MGLMACVRCTAPACLKLRTCCDTRPCLAVTAPHHDCSASLIPPSPACGRGKAATVMHETFQSTHRRSPSCPPHPRSRHRTLPLCPSPPVSPCAPLHRPRGNTLLLQLPRLARQNPHTPWAQAQAQALLRTARQGPACSWCWCRVYATGTHRAVELISAWHLVPMAVLVSEGVEVVDAAAVAAGSGLGPGAPGAGRWVTWPRRAPWGSRRWPRGRCWRRRGWRSQRQLQWG